METLTEKSRTVALFMGAKVVGEYFGSKGGYSDSVLLDFGTSECEQNKLHFPGNSRFWADTQLKFHNDYNWVMPVVTKLKNTKSKNYTLGQYPKFKFFNLPSLYTPLSDVFEECYKAVQFLNEHDD